MAIVLHEVAGLTRKSRHLASFLPRSLPPLVVSLSGGGYHQPLQETGRWGWAEDARESIPLKRELLTFVQPWTEASRELVGRLSSRWVEGRRSFCAGVGVKLGWCVVRGGRGSEGVSGGRQLTGYETRTSWRLKNVCIYKRWSECYLYITWQLAETKFMSW